MRFLERIDEPEKNWRFSLADSGERKFWKHYMKTYEECLRATSPRDALWYVVPADDKEKVPLTGRNCIRSASGSRSRILSALAQECE